MKKFTQITSKVVPLPIKDVDTDMIIPAQFLTSVSREGYGQNLFRRFKDADANFALNQKRYEGAKILLADDNFGCGSSREHAVWALQGAGFDVVISKSFADIFAGNSAKNGLLLVTLKSGEVDDLLSQSAKTDIVLTVDLPSQTVKTDNGVELKFEIDPFRKHCILNGLDDIDYILSHKEEIESYRNGMAKNRFFSTLEKNN